MAALFMQRMYGPKPDENAGADKDLAPVVAPEDPAGDSPDADEPADKAADPEVGNGEESDLPAVQDTNADLGAAVSQTGVDNDFVKIGSLSEDGSDRYLITVNRKAGTIHQVELNARDSSGRFRYRDIVFEGGYLGSTNVLSTSSGLVVNAVGPKTPADIAGLKKGDAIVAMTNSAGESQPMVEVENINKWLNEETEPGDSISIDVKRNGSPNLTTLNATLIQKPISIIRPEDGRVDPDFDYPESFVFSLLKPMDYINRAWPDLAPQMRNEYWEVTERSNDQMVELKYEISADQLKAFELPGPLTVFKRFSLPVLDDESRGAIDSRTYHIDLEIEIVNGSDKAVELAYEIDGPTGLTAETWWYANKIHGRQMAIGYVAGARDIVASTGDNSYAFFGCPEIVKEASKTKRIPFYICDPSLEDANNRNLKFIGVDSHYFNVTLKPVVDGEFLEVNSATAFPNSRDGRLPVIPTNTRLQRLVDCTFQMVVPASVPANGSYIQKYEIFCGPKDAEVLDDYGLSDVRTFGWFSWFSYLLLNVLHFFYWITFKTSYGLSIIMLTVVVRCIMIPFSRKAALNAQMMQHLAPQIKEISDKYAEDMEKRAEAQKELYKKYNFNPLGGCFMMFFQLPIFYGLYKALNVDIALRDQALIPGLQWCSNLAAPDQLFYWKDYLPFWLADETGYLGPYLNILPLLTMVLFIAQQKLFTPPPTDDQQKFMQRMMTFMMLFMGLMFFKVPAGLCIYFITSSLWGIIERKLLPKPVLDTDRFGDEPAKVTKSAKELRAEERAESERAAEVEARKKRNSERKKKLKNRQN